MQLCPHIAPHALCIGSFACYDIPSTHTHTHTPLGCGAGLIDMKEFLHALVLVMRGSHHEKLEMVFTIMDLDNDGK